MTEELTQQQKTEMLENAVICRSAAETEEVCKSLGKILFSARALGIACRFKGIDYVKALVENGATFYYDREEVREEVKLPNESYIIQYKIDFSLGMLRFSDNMKKRSYLQEYLDDMCFPDPFNPEKLNITIEILPLEERLKCFDYLASVKDKVNFDPQQFLYNAVVFNNIDMVKALRERGIDLAESKKIMATKPDKETAYNWYEFIQYLGLMNNEEFRSVSECLLELTGAETLKYTEGIFYDIMRYRLEDPEFFRFIVTHFDPKKMNKTEIMREIINRDALPCLPVCEEVGWLSMNRRRDELIEHATEKKKTEAIAWLMDFKNRTADFAAEREKAEKKMQRKLNSNPNPVVKPEKIWSYKKQDDGTLVITNYKGSNLELKVPEKIGEDTVTAIGPDGLGAFREITKITLPSTIQSIGKEAFRCDRSLLEVNIPDGVTEIGESTFKDCERIKSIKLPDSVQKIGKKAFQGCYKLEQINIPQGVAEITENMFTECYSLKSVEIPDSVRVIGREAFYKCTKLEQIVIPDGVEEIKQLAFGSCPNLKTVVIPASVKKISVYRSATFPPSGLNSEELAKVKLSQYPPITIFRYSKNVTVITEPKSCAERYCKKYNIPYKYAEM